MRHHTYRKSAQGWRQACLRVVVAGLVAFGHTSVHASEDDDDGGRAGPPVNPLAEAGDCLGSLARYFKDRNKKDLDAAVQSGRRLLELQSIDSKGRMGWAYTRKPMKKTGKCEPNWVDAFSDGTCNPPETPYMIQTGYAIGCLAQLQIAGQLGFVDAARKAAKDSWNLGVAPKGCPNCFMYWYSYHDNDNGRYVRNTSLIMGLGLAWLNAATGDASYASRALAVAEAERRELRKGNLGYLGMDDPRYLKNPTLESGRIENHLGHHIKALKDIALVLNQPKLLEDAGTLMTGFLDCNKPQCKPNNCAVWAAPAACKHTWTIVPCILADVNPQFAPRCDVALKGAPRLSAFQTFVTAPASTIKSAAAMRSK